MRKLLADQVVPALMKGATARKADLIEPNFKPGDTVIAKNMHPPGHTRIPRYVRGKKGIIARDHGVFIFPDTHASHNDPNPQHVYSVCFIGQELWGETAPSQDKIYVDLWEDYLELS